MVETVPGDVAAPLVRRFDSRRLLRNPLTWAVVVELCLAGALGAVAWHMLHSHRASPGAIVSSLPLPWATPPPIPHIGIPNAGRPTTAASKARLRTDPAFIHSQLSAINHDESAWEGAEWMIFNAAMSAARGYLDHVVVPAVERAPARH